MAEPMGKLPPIDPIAVTVIEPSAITRLTSLPLYVLPNSAIAVAWKSSGTPPTIALRLRSSLTPLRLGDPLQCLSGEAGSGRSDLIDPPLRNDSAAFLSSSRPEIDDPVRRLDHIEIVFEDDDRVPLSCQAMQDPDQPLDVLEVKARGGLIEYVEGVAPAVSRQLLCELEPLGLAAAQRRRALAKPEVAKSGIEQHLKLSREPALFGEERSGFPDLHLENLGDRVTAPSNVQNFPSIALASAFAAADPEIRQELHVDPDRAQALTGVAASTLHIEAEGACRKTANLRFGRAGEQRADLIEKPHGGAVGLRLAKQAIGMRS